MATTDQRECEERNSRHRFAKDARKEAVYAIGLLPCFGHDTLIADQQIAVSRREQVGAHEGPEDCRPGQGGMKEALDGTIAATVWPSGQAPAW